jgi:site-specific recombinase XerD
MASIFKKKGIWRIAYFKGGKRFTRSLRTYDEKYARLLKKEYEVKLENNELQDGRQISVEAFYQEYLRDITHRKRSTNVADLSRLKNFIKQSGKKTVNGISRDDILAYLARYENLSNKSFNHALGTVRHFLGLAIKSGYLKRNPVEGIHRKRMEQSLPRFLTDEEYLRIEKAAEGDPLWPMLVVARYTGARLGELRHLEWTDFDWERRLVRIVNKPKFKHTVKNYQIRSVPIGKEFTDKLLPYIRPDGLCFPAPNGLPYNPEGPRRFIRTVLKEAKVREGKGRMGWHDFRHTFASRLAQMGISIYKICKWLGHSSVVVTQIYANFSPMYDGDIEKLTIQSFANQSAVTQD